MKQVLLLNIHNSKNNKSIYSCQHLLNILYLDNYKSDTYKNKIFKCFCIIFTITIFFNLQYGSEEGVWEAPGKGEGGGPMLCD